jgi:hypothetical protein
MTKDELIEIIKGILKTDIDLNFLLQLKERELETLIACIRGRIDLARERLLILHSPAVFLNFL